MQLITSDCLNAVCADPAVGGQVAALETRRREAMRSFWLWVLGGLVAAAACFVSLQRAGWDGPSYFAILIPLAALFAGNRGLARVAGGLKVPVLEAIAGRAGLRYVEEGFSPPVYAAAEKLLFGRLSSRTFTDLIQDADESGQRLALYEAELVRGSGRSRHTVFKGQIYAVERRRAGGAVTVIVPDRGLFNFLKPPGMDRVRIESDPDFERRFEVYSTSEMEARQLLFDSAWRARLLELRRLGPVFVYAGADGALLATSTRRDRFEPGSMFSARPAEERVKAMVEDVCAALPMLAEVKAKLG
jgi:hypothetical protein